MNDKTTALLALNNEISDLTELTVSTFSGATIYFDEKGFFLDITGDADGDVLHTIKNTLLLSGSR